MRFVIGTPQSGRPCRYLLDRGAIDAQRLRPGRPAGMGPRSWTLNIHNDVFRRCFPWERNLGTSCRARRPSRCITQEVEQDRGPVLITVEYRIDPREREPFLAALEKLGQERRRDGAYAWEVALA